MPAGGTRLAGLALAPVDADGVAGAAGGAGDAEYFAVECPGAGLSEADYQQVPWPSQGEEPRQVGVGVVTTRVRKLYRSQVIIVRESLDGSLKETRYFASSDLAADVATLVGHLAARWKVEVLFVDGKELLGLDQYQVMRAESLVHFWTLVWAAYSYLDEERARLRQQWQRYVTLGEARREVQGMHWCHLITWMQQQFQAGTPPQTLFEQSAA